MSKYTIDEIKKAVRIMGLSDTATVTKIKKRFKELIARWHPDKCKEHPEKCKDMAQQINKAYETIMKYCTHYEISFKTEDIEKTMAKGDDTWWFARFGDDPIWGK